MISVSVILFLDQLAGKSETEISAFLIISLINQINKRGIILFEEWYAKKIRVHVGVAWTLLFLYSIPSILVTSRNPIVSDISDVFTNNLLQFYTR